MDAVRTGLLRYRQYRQNATKNKTLSTIPLEDRIDYTPLLRDNFLKSKEFVVSAVPFENRAHAANPTH